jgi:hypothetical protein
MWVHCSYLFGSPDSIRSRRHTHVHEHDRERFLLFDGCLYFLERLVTLSAKLNIKGRGQRARASRRKELGIQVLEFAVCLIVVLAGRQDFPEFIQDGLLIIDHQYPRII